MFDKRLNVDGFKDLIDVHFASNVITNLKSTDASLANDEIVEEILEKRTYFNKNGSNWRFEMITSLDLHTHSCL